MGALRHAITLGTAAWNRYSLMVDRVLFVDVTFMVKVLESGTFSKAKITFKPSLSKAVTVGTSFSENERKRARKMYLKYRYISCLSMLLEYFKYSA